MAAAPLPPLNLDFGSASSSALNTSGSLYHASGDGDWVVNFGGSGSGLFGGFGGFGGFGATSASGASAGGLPSWLLLAALAGVAWIVFKR